MNFNLNFSSRFDENASLITHSKILNTEEASTRYYSDTSYIQDKTVECKEGIDNINKIDSTDNNLLYDFKSAINIMSSQ